MKSQELFEMGRQIESSVARAMKPFLREQHKQTRYLQRISRLETHMAGELDDLTAEVSNNTTVEKSALALIQGFAAQLAAAGTDPVKLKALHDSLKANDDELAAAVAANTPATP